MAKTLQYSLSPEDPSRIMAHLIDHLANYAQYFEVEQRGPKVIALRIREVVPKEWQFQNPGFLIQVTKSGPGCRIALQRTLTPAANWFLGLWVAAAALALAAGLALLTANPSEGRRHYPFIVTAGSLTLAGLVFRQVAYWIKSGRDPEFTNILQKALADFGRPTAIRRREESRGPGTGTPAKG